MFKIGAGLVGAREGPSWRFWAAFALTSQAVESIGVTAGEAPGAVDFVFAAEFIGLRRMVTRFRPVTHFAELGRGD